eukprot:143727-Rhodomonas_salina.3
MQQGPIRSAGFQDFAALVGGLPYRPTRALRDVRYMRVVCAIGLRAPYAMSGAAPTVLRLPYAMSGTDIAYGATRHSSFVRGRTLW